MDDIDWSDRAFYDDGEWVTWSEIDEQLRYKEWGAKYPNAIRSMIPYFEDLISLAESYHRETGLHLAVYGDIGELFGAITYGIRLNKTYAQGADGRLGNDHVEVKTITPSRRRMSWWSISASRCAWPKTSTSSASGVSLRSDLFPPAPRRLRRWRACHRSGCAQIHRLDQHRRMADRLAKWGGCKCLR